MYADKFILTIDLANDVEYSVEIQVSDIPLKGNVQVSNDDEADKKAEQWVENQLDLGNEYAWCDVVVYARVCGHEGFDSLGACTASSRNELDALIKDHEMHKNALDDLKKKLLETGAKLAS